MNRFKNYNFGETEVTSIITDTSSYEYVWIAFAKNANNICKIKKVSAHNLYQTFYTIELEVEAIVDMKILGQYLFVALEDSTYIGYRFSLSNPTGLGDTNQYAVTKPVGINENPIALTVSQTNTNDVYFLCPGILSGENTKVVKFTSVGITFDETIDLDRSAETIRNAISLTTDSNDDLWVITSDNPTKLIRIYEASGGIYTFTSHDLV